MLREALLRWPVIRQILEGGDGTGPEAMSERTRQLEVLRLVLARHHARNPRA